MLAQAACLAIVDKLTEGKKSLNDWALMSEKCMPQNIQVKGSLMAALRPSQVPPTCSTLPPFDSSTRYCAISLSSSVSQRVFSGQLLRVSQKFSSIARGKYILRQDEERCDSDKDRYTAFDDEEPLPATFVSMVIRGLQVRGLITCKDLPDRPCGGECRLQGSPR